MVKADSVLYKEPVSSRAGASVFLVGILWWNWPGSIAVATIGSAFSGAILLRSFRPSLRIDGSDLVVVNFFKTHRIRRSDILSFSPEPRRLGPYGVTLSSGWRVVFAASPPTWSKKRVALHDRLVEFLRDG